MHQSSPISTLPDLWLLSDARNDARLEKALYALPCPAGFVFRHYHLDDNLREARFHVLADIAQNAGHMVILSGEAEQAIAWGADGIYGSSARMDTGLPFSGLRIATAHNEAEIIAANGIGADAVMLSPIFPTRSHPAGKTLGPERFRALTALADMPVIALGGMTRERATALNWPRWAAVDGLV